MVERLAQFDRQLFLAINGWHSPALDAVMVLLSNLYLWIPLYVFFLFLIQRRKGWRGLFWSVPVIAALVFMTDTGSVLIFKETVQRLRPCKEEELQGLVHLVNGQCAGLYGFVSSHASNHFGIAAFMAGMMQGRPAWVKWALFGWAALIAYSRIYLGQHYPGDVFVGAAYGFTMGWTFFLIFQAISMRVTPKT